jgi:hypothetical protein
MEILLSDDEVEGQNDANWDFIPLGDQKSIGIRTEGLEDKLTACEMLVSFARELGPSFGQYVEPVLTFMLTQLKYVFHDGVRSAAADCLPALLGCVRSQGIEVERALFNQILPALM